MAQNRGKNRAEKYLETTLGHSISVLESFPKYFLIEPINTCNARCIMCGIDFDGKNKGVMTDALFDKITDEISRFADHVEKVQLYYDCEPLMDPKLHVKIKKMKDVGVKVVNIATNASILSTRRAKELIEAGLDEIYITVDSLNKEVFEAIRIRLNFDKVYKNTVDFIKLRDDLNPNLNIRLQMVSLALNQGEEEEFIQHWSKLLSERDHVVVHKAHNWGGKAEVMEFGDESTVNEIPCTTLWANACIHVDGSVGLCSVDTTENSPHSLGNINDQTVEEVWKGLPLREMRKLHLAGRRSEKPMCDGCTAWREFNNIVHHVIEKNSVLLA